MKTGAVDSEDSVCGRVACRIREMHADSSDSGAVGQWDGRSCTRHQPAAWLPFSVSSEPSSLSVSSLSPSLCSRLELGFIILRLYTTERSVIAPSVYIQPATAKSPRVVYPNV